MNQWLSNQLAAEKNWKIRDASKEVGHGTKEFLDKTEELAVHLNRSDRRARRILGELVKMDLKPEHKRCGAQYFVFSVYLWLEINVSYISTITDRRVPKPGESLPNMRGPFRMEKIKECSLFLLKC